MTQVGLPVDADDSDFEERVKHTINSTSEQPFHLNSTRLFFGRRWFLICWY